MNARHGALIFHLQSRPRTPFLSHRKTLPFSLLLLNSSITQRRENYPDIIGLITARGRPGEGKLPGPPARRAQAGAWLLGSSRSPSERCSGHRLPPAGSELPAVGDVGAVSGTPPASPLPLGGGMELGGGWGTWDGWSTWDGWDARGAARSCVKRPLSNAGKKEIIPDCVKSHTGLVAPPDWLKGR